jgi:hypothetical protein
VSRELAAAAAQGADLDDSIQNLGGLISLALALVTVFTAQRWQAMRDRRAIEGKTKLRVLQGAAVDLVLLVLTLALTLAATPIVVDAVDELSIGRSRGALRSTFVVVWVLLVGLIVWQVSIAWRTLRQAKGRPWR